MSVIKVLDELRLNLMPFLAVCAHLYAFRLCVLCDLPELTRGVLHRHRKYSMCRPSSALSVPLSSRRAVPPMCHAVL